MTNWIKFNERTPSEKECDSNHHRFLVYGIPTCPLGCYWRQSCDGIWSVREARWKEQEFEFGEYDCPINVTHWMPLPEKPDD